MRPKAVWAIDSQPIQARGIIVNKLLISLYAKISKDFDFFELSNFSRDLLIPLVSNFQSVLSAQAPMESFCNTIMPTILDKTVEKIAYLAGIFSKLRSRPLLPSPPPPWKQCCWVFKGKPDL